MFIFAFFALALASVVLARGRLGALADVHLRHAWSIGAALAAQVLVLTILPGQLEGIHAPVHMGSYGLAAFFLWANRSIPGLWLMGIGGAVNFAVITLNGGVMPASESALEAAGIAPDKGQAFANSALLEEPRLGLLGDIFAIPEALPLSNVFSLGDLSIAIGVLIALHTICGSRLKPADADAGLRAWQPTPGSRL